MCGYASFCSGEAYASADTIRQCPEGPIRAPGRTYGAHHHEEKRYPPPLASRRFFLRASLASAFALGTMPLAGSDVLAAGKGDNVLVVYFSHSGNTRTIAEMIHQRVGGDIVELTSSPA